MAKIIDFKTRKLLADLPFKRNQRIVKGFRASGLQSQGAKVYIIACNEIDGDLILKQIENTVLKKTKKSA